jgi:hypothetical protein
MWGCVLAADVVRHSRPRLTKVATVNIKIALLFVFSAVSLEAQSFYPLEIGNRWDFSDTSWGISGGGIRETTSVSIVADTVMANGFRYFIFSGQEPSGGLFARADSNWIYYYDHYQTHEDVPFYKLDANVNDQWNVTLGRWFFVTYAGTYTHSLFGVPITVKQYYLDGLAVAYAWLSDRFGPIGFWDLYDPPGIWNTYRTLIGAIISDTLYGTIVSVDDDPLFPNQYYLAQNFPNPFNPTTSIHFTVPRRTSVSLKVFDILGRDITTLASGEFEPGTYHRQWNAEQNSSGIYFYRFQTPDFVETRTMVFLR